MNISRTATSALLVTLAAAPAAADHGAGLRVEGLSPLVSALLAGGLAFVVALVVVVVIMVLTRPSSGHQREPDER